MNKNRLYRAITLVIAIFIAAPLLVASSANWSTPQNLSGWQFNTIPLLPQIGTGADGTHVVIWKIVNSSTSVQASVWGRLRPSGGDWTAAELIFDWTENYFDPYIEVTSDGTAWVMWGIQDLTQPGDNWQVRIAHLSGAGSWQVEAISDWETSLRSIHLYLSPDGFMVATWVACTDTDYKKGPCDVRIRRRFPNAATWEPVDYSLDATIDSILMARSLVAPEGLIVTTWAEMNPTDSSQWGVMSRSYDTASSTWESSPINISGYFEADYGPTMAKPVMGVDGIVVLAWVEEDPLDVNKSILYSSTRLAATGTWSSKKNVSGAIGAYIYELPMLVMGENGITIALWGQENPLNSSERAIYANVRDPGSPWGNAMRVSDWKSYVSVKDVSVWPDGTAMLFWWLMDGNRDPTEDETLYWSIRPPNASWGDGGSGQLGSWFDSCSGANLERREDGSAVAIWAVSDASLPIDERASILTTIRPPGSSWEPPETLLSGYHDYYIFKNNLVAVAGSLAATWSVNRNDSDPYAVFFAELLPDNTAPTASFSIQPASGPTSTNFKFDASGSSDLEDPLSALEFRWDWQADGSYDTSWDVNPFAYHGYPTAGIYTVRLQVIDTGGLTTITTRNVTVTSDGGITGSKFLYLPCIVK